MINPSLSTTAYTGKNRTFGIPDLLAFVVGLLSANYINVVGNLYLSEIFLLVLLPYLLYSRRSLLRVGYTRLIILLGGAWLLNQIITDLYRGIPITDSIKGWALIAFLLSDFLALYLLVFPNTRRIALGVLGLVISLVPHILLQPSSHILADPWKFGVGESIALLTAIVGFYLYKDRPRQSAWLIVALILISVFSFYVRSRALGGFTLLTAFTVWFRFTYIGRSIASRINNFMVLMWSFIFSLGLSWGIIQAYGYMASLGYLGDDAYYIYNLQSSGDFGILLGGRREWLPAIHAILDSPFMGHGSYARNTEYGQYLYELTNMGYIVNNDQLDKYLAARNFIPTHSHLLQGWVWAGLAGGFFWLFILALTFHVLVGAYRYPNSFFMITMFLGFSSVWAVLFSPFTNTGRLHWAFVLVIFLYTLINSFGSVSVAGYNPISSNQSPVS
jgi:hypothetical protein